MSFLLLMCLLTEVALMTEARVCSLGNERDPDRREVTRWVTLPVDDPCDCSTILPGGFNAVPVLQSGGLPFVQTDRPVISSDPGDIQRHFDCDPIQQRVQDTTVQPNKVATTPSSPHGEWLELMYYDRSNPNSIELDSSVLDKWKSSHITEVKISLRSNNRSQLELVFDASGCNSTSWFTYDRLLNSPWKDLDHNAKFIFNWTAKGPDILGIHAELRGNRSVEGWLRWVPHQSSADESQIWATEKLPVIAFARTLSKVHWMDRNLLSRGRPSSQSSTPAPARGEFGVDFDTTTRSSTGYEFEPWWVVDMGDTFSLEEIVIMACAPGKGKTELTGAQFRVGFNPAMEKEGTPCGLPITDPAREGNSITVLCEMQNDLPSGRYLGMRIDGDYGALGFCDIFVDADGRHTPELEGRPTWQSSVLARNASLCVDGMVGVHEADLTCCQTDEDSDPWWQVDLGAIVTVTMVVISPFPDLTKWIDMAGAKIVVGNTADDPFVVSVVPCGGALAVEDLQKHRPLPVECVPSVDGRYVFITGNNKPVSMCEVEVFGKSQGDVYYADALRIQAFATV